MKISVNRLKCRNLITLDTDHNRNHYLLNIIHVNLGHLDQKKYI